MFYIIEGKLIIIILLLYSLQFIIINIIEVIIKNFLWYCFIYYL
jgi:hypothetical protein